MFRSFVLRIYVTHVYTFLVDGWRQSFKRWGHWVEDDLSIGIRGRGESVLGFTYTVNPNSTLDSGAEANGIFFAWALELRKQKLLHTQGFVIEKVNLYISSFFFSPTLGSKRHLSPSQHYSQELIMQSSCWRRGTSLNPPLSFGKLVIAAWYF